MKRGRLDVKLYVLVRKDLGSMAYSAVQAGHAVAEYLLRYGQLNEWQNGTLVYLGINNEEELTFWGEKLTWKGIGWVGFREPDIGNQLTAIACLSDGQVFSKLKLLGEE